MKLLPVLAVIALTTATAAYAQSGNNAPTSLTPSNQGQHVQNGAKANSKASPMAATKTSRMQQDQNENRVTEELNRQQEQLASKYDNTLSGPAAPQTATKPDDMSMAPPSKSQQ